MALLANGFGTTLGLSSVKQFKDLHANVFGHLCSSLWRASLFFFFEQAWRASLTYLTVYSRIPT